MHDSRHVLCRMDLFTAFPAGLDLGLNALHAGAVLLVVVECGDHNMPPFPPMRVITVVTDDETLDAVIFGVHARHSSTLTPAIRSDPLASSAELALRPRQERMVVGSMTA